VTEVRLQEFDSAVAAVLARVEEYLPWATKSPALPEGRGAVIRQGLTAGKSGGIFSFPPRARER